MIPKTAVFRKFEAWSVPLIVVLVGLTAFGLGRLSALETSSTPAAAAEPAVGAGKGELRIYQQDLSAAPAAATAQNFVASKNGTRYYLPTCSGATRINEENKVWFESREAAEASGYTPAANCPGL